MLANPSTRTGRLAPAAFHLAAKPAISATPLGLSCAACSPNRTDVSIGKAEELVDMGHAIVFGACAGSPIRCTAGGTVPTCGFGNRWSWFALDRRKLPALCCTTCASSCAIRRRPAVVPGWYCPAPKTMLLPVVYASDCICRADRAAMSPVCRRTPLKSYPNLDSKKRRSGFGSDCPAPRSARISRAVVEVISGVLPGTSFACRLFSGSGSVFECDAHPQEGVLKILWRSLQFLLALWTSALYARLYAALYARLYASKSGADRAFRLLDAGIFRLAHDRARHTVRFLFKHIAGLIYGQLRLNHARRIALGILLT